MGTKRRTGIDESLLELEPDKIFEVKTINEVKDLIRGKIVKLKEDQECKQIFPDFL